MKTSCLTLVMLLIGSTLFAQIFVKQNANGANNGSSWSNAFTSLSDAIDAASADDEIWVATGTYKAGNAGNDPASTYFFVDKKIHLFGGFAGNEAAISEREIDSNPTILSADLNGDDIPDNFTDNRSDNGFHVLFLDSLSEGSTLDGFTIEGGQAKVGQFPFDVEIDDWSGGGVLVKGSCLVSHCTFRQNAGAVGAAFLSVGGTDVSVQSSRVENNYSTFGSFGMDGHDHAELIDCVFEQNTSEEYGGGATLGNTNVDILNCQFSNNTSLEEGGGGLFIFQNNEAGITDPIVHIEGCSFTGNTAPRAGGMLMNNFANGTQITMLECVFENNSATGIEGKAGGLGLRNQEGASGVANLNAVLLDCDFKGNTAPEAAGAYFWCRDYELVLEMEGCEFTENTSENKAGGAELNAYNNGRIFATIDQTVFRKNAAENEGAGLSIINDNPTFRLHATLTKCTFEENTSPGLGAAMTTSSGNPALIPGPIVNLSESNFIGNDGEAGCGAIWASSTTLTISDCLFEANSTTGEIAGGAALGLMENEATLIKNSRFLNNSSDGFGGAIFQYHAERMLMLDNVVIKGNEGEGAVYTEDSLMLRNVSLVANDGGLFMGGDNATAMIQNSLFVNSGDNFVAEDEAEVVSLGGNLSHDLSLSGLLMGADGYADQHGLSPMLDDDLRPVMGSPCVDRGNPEGIENDASDAAGELRIQGTSVDIGAYESAFEITGTNDKAPTISVEVFPNPFSETITIQSEEEPLRIRLLDCNGRWVENLLPNNGQLMVNQQLPSGQYFVEITLKNEVVQKKIVKK